MSWQDFYVKICILEVDFVKPIFVLNLIHNNLDRQHFELNPHLFWEPENNGCNNMTVCLEGEHVTREPCDFIAEDMQARSCLIYASLGNPMLL